MTRKTLRRFDATEADTLRAITRCPQVGVDQMVNSWKEWRKIERNTNTDNSSLPPTDVESAPGDESLATEEGAGLDKRCRVHVHSKRRRLCDPDGISAKAAIDGLVAAKLLRDDSAKFIKEVSFSQEVSEVEETIIEITWKTKS